LQETEPKAKGPPPTPKAQEPKAAGPPTKAGERMYHIGRNVTWVNPTPEQLQQAQREFEQEEDLRRRRREAEDKAAREERKERRTREEKAERSGKKPKTEAAPETKMAEAKPTPKSQQVLTRPAAAVPLVEPKAKPKKEHPADSECTFTDTYVWESEEEEAVEQDTIVDYF